MIIDLHQAFKAYLRISLRSCKPLMSQQFLHTSHVCASLQQVGGKRMAQAVGRHGKGQSRPAAQPLHNAGGLSSVEARAPAAHKKGRLVGQGQQGALFKPAFQTGKRCV